MRKLITLTKTLGLGATAAVALSLMSATPAAAQYRDYNSGDPLSALLRGVAGAVINGSGSQYGAQYGSRNYRGPDCVYYRDGRCYRNVGHWEREHGIDSRDYDRRDYDGRNYDGRDYDRRDDYRYGQVERYQNGRHYDGRGYYRDGRWYRNHGQWRSSQNREYRSYRGW